MGSDFHHIKGEVIKIGGAVLKKGLSLIFIVTLFSRILIEMV